MKFGYLERSEGSSGSRGSVRCQKTTVSRCGKGTRKLRGGNEVAKWRQAKGEIWRRGWELNPRIKVLQTSPLPLGYRASVVQYIETVPHFQPGRCGRECKTYLC
jgi:hypothetical protein